MGSAFGATWEDPEGGIIKFAVKRALKQDQTLHMEGKLHIILYLREEWQILIQFVFQMNLFLQWSYKSSIEYTISTWSATNYFRGIN